MTPMAWVAKELSIEARANEIAKHSLRDVAKELRISADALQSYITLKRRIPDHVYLYCRQRYQMDFSYIMTALRNRKSLRGEHLKKKTEEE